MSPITSQLVSVSNIRIKQQAIIFFIFYWLRNYIFSFGGIFHSWLVDLSDFALLSDLHIQNFDAESKRHREVDVTLRHMDVKSFNDQYKANHHQE